MERTIVIQNEEVTGFEIKCPSCGLEIVVPPTLPEEENGKIPEDPVPSNCPKCKSDLGTPALVVRGLRELRNQSRRFAFRINQ